MRPFLLTNQNHLNHIILAIYILLIVYIILILPNIREDTIALFDNVTSKLATLFIIIYISISNPILAILLSFAFILTLQELMKRKLQKSKQKATCLDNQETSDSIFHDKIVNNYSLDTSSDSQQLIKHNLDVQTNAHPTSNQRKKPSFPKDDTPNIEDMLHINNKNESFSQNHANNSKPSGIEGYFGNYSVLDNVSPYP